MDHGQATLPLIVGITGHIDILGKDKEALREKVGQFFTCLKAEYPNTPIVVLNSLALGADQLCAEVALCHGISLTAVLPMPLEEYLKDFVDEAAINTFIAASSNIIVAPAFETMPANPPRGFFYRQAGHYIANNCHILLALWNGEEKLSLEGGGTYETLTFANTSLVKNKLYRIETPRLVGLVTPRSSQSEKNHEIKLYNLDGFNKQMQFDVNYKDLKILDVYNADCKKNTANKVWASFKDYYSVFDGLAIYYQNKTKRMLQSYSFLGFALICSFLLYDELESNFMLLIYGTALLVLGGLYIASKRKDYHQKHINYRALSENFRIQKIFETAGITKNCYDCYSFAANDELGFVRTFILGYKNVVEPHLEEKKQFAVADWVEQQYQYHTETFCKKTKIDCFNDNVSRVMIIASVLMFIIVVVLEFFFPFSIEVEYSLRRIGEYLMLHQNQPLSVRSIIKILLGAVSATTAILSNYYGRLSLNEQVRSNGRMIKIFAAAREKIDKNGVHGIDDDVLFQIGCECIGENVNWYISELKNEPEVVIG